MLTFFSLILCLIFLTISLFHFYWAFGGDWGLEHVVPKTSSEEKALKPPLFLTIIVAIAFLAMMTLYLFHLGYLSWAIPEWILQRQIPNCSSRFVF